MFVDSIEKINPDICGLNEVRGEGPLEGYTDQANALGDGLGYNRYFAEAIKVEGTSPYGNAFVTKYPIKSAETVAIPDPEDKSEPTYYESRCVIKAIVEVDERGVTTTLVEDMLNIDVCYGQACITYKSLACGDDIAIFGNYAVTRKYEVGR